MHVVIRQYTDASQLFDILATREQDVREIILTVPGFQGYQLVRTSQGGFSVTTCDDKAGTDESSRRAANWIKLNIPEDAMREATIVEGDTLFSFLAEIARTEA